MLTSLHHRGPDSHSTWSSSDDQVMFGHSRLSIVDLSTDGAQPMTSPSGRYVISFNGEIYNHKDLRRELKNLNPNLIFRGHSDTEIMLTAFDQWGVKEAIKRFVGMFAVAIWDECARTLILSRDRFGEKPLLFGWVGSGVERRLVFASELRSFLLLPDFSRRVSASALQQYLGLGVVPDDTSILQGVQKVPPSSILYFKSHSAAPTKDTYWSLRENLLAACDSPDKHFNGAELVNLTKRKLETAVSQQLEADVPVGIFLSGGVDSSLIAALAQKFSSKPVSTFSIGFDNPEIDESEQAALVAKCLSTNHRSLKITDGDLLTVIPSLPSIYDEPFSDSSQIPTVLLSKLARKEITVALSGDGADELFFGYSRYFRAISWWTKLRMVPAPLRLLASQIGSCLPHAEINAASSRVTSEGRISRLGEIIRNYSPAMASQDLVSLHLAIANATRLAEFGKASIREKKFEGDLGHDLILAHSDLVQYLPSDILVKTDRAAMSVSLETRSPFLDVNVAEHALRLPTHLKWKNQQNKWVLRQILSEYVPASISERPKQGFDVPLAQWLRGPLKDWGAALVAKSSELSEFGLNSRRINEMWELHQKGRFNYHDALWPVIMLSAWADHYLGSR